MNLVLELYNNSISSLRFYLFHTVYLSRSQSLKLRQTLILILLFLLGYFLRVPYLLILNIQTEDFLGNDSSTFRREFWPKSSQINGHPQKGTRWKIIQTQVVYLNIKFSWYHLLRKDRSVWLYADSIPFQWIFKKIRVEWESVDRLTSAPRTRCVLMARCAVKMRVEDLRRRWRGVPKSWLRHQYCEYCTQGINESKSKGN